MSQDTQVFVGAGQWTSAKKSGALYRGDGGEHWEQLTKGLPKTRSPSRRSPSIHESRHRLRRTQDGPYRSTDGRTDVGAHEFPSGSRCGRSAFHPRDPRIVFGRHVARPRCSAATTAAARGGGSRREAARPDHDGVPDRVMRIGITPGNPDAIYAALEVAGGHAQRRRR